MPSGETVVFAFERRQGDDRFGPGDIVMLNSFYAHLARAGLMAARLGLERAHATVSALNALGLPAAVMSAAGRVLTTNEQFDAMFHTFRPAAYGGMAITDAPANNLFQEAIAAGREDREPLVRSIPLRSIPNRAAAVVHLLPLRRAAQDLFSGAATLLVATEIKPEAHVPHSTLLSALFDLTPAEARLAAALAAGKSLKQTAAEMGISFGSARTYLARIFSKTGTHQQSQLVALLKSAQPMSS